VNSLDSHINNLKDKLDGDFFSPSFIRLANIYYLNNKFEDCIKLCKIGIDLFPDYLTPKILLIKALLKLEYVNEAEAELIKIENKIQKTDIYEIFKNKINSLKKTATQERIYYPEDFNKITDYKSFEKKIKKLLKNLNESGHYFEGDLNENPDVIYERPDSGVFDIFLEKISSVRLNKDASEEVQEVSKENLTSETENLFSNMKIVTETLADIYAKQGKFQEAFNAYNFLLRANSPSKQRIEEKLIALERNFINDNEF